jgi:mannose-1-phosphate guanylyltransferase/phosphomannomutase
VTVRERATVTRSVVDASSHIGRSATVEGAMLGRSCDVRAHARIQEGAAIGDECTLGPESVVMPGIRIYPYKEVEAGTIVDRNVIWESRAASRLAGGARLTGLVNVDLTPETAMHLGMALGTALPRGSRIVASRGAQPACRLIKRALLAGVLSTGVHADDLRVMPAAVSRHLLKVQGYGAGVHVRPSAVDPEAVQIDIFEQPGIQASPALEKEITKHFARQEFRRASYADLGELGYPGRAAEGYVDDLLRTLDRDLIARRGFRIVVDYCYSPASLILPLVFGPLSIEKIAAHSYVAARSPSAGDVTESLEQTRRLVTVVGADFGVVMDQAAERIYLMDEQGEPVPTDVALLLFVSLLARAGREGTLALPITATSRIDELVAGGGLAVHRTQASLAALTRAASEDGTIFAGAVTGGFVFPAFLPAYDAVASICNLLELLAPIAEPLSSLVAALPAANLRHVQVRCPWAQKGMLMRVLTERMKPYETDLLDGIKVFHEHGWALVLPDPDEPLVHVYAEGDTAEEAGRLNAELRELVEGILAAEEAPATVA